VSLILLLALAAIALAGLVGERIRLDRHRNAIPLLIAVTGTRGKSSVTRMLAAVFRESGRRVLAKTTGSEATLVLPDGSEEEVRRRGPPSIIEQKRIIKLAAQLCVDAAIIEVMSIHPENHLVETRRLLKPDMVLVTNFRVDHTAALGATREAVASVLALDVPPGARVLVPRSECLPTFRTSVEDEGGELIEVSAGTGATPRDGDPVTATYRFGENLDLVWAAAQALGIDDRSIRAGIDRSRGDIGSLRVWRYQQDVSQLCFLVNAFAVNDPESTALVFDRVTGALGREMDLCVGLLSLRPDRGDRTLQWLTALREGFLERFDHLYVMGLHAQALERRLKRFSRRTPVEALEVKGPEETTRTVLPSIREARGLVFGFGNMVGPGEGLIAHWNAIGEPFEV